MTSALRGGGGVTQYVTNTTDRLRECVTKGGRGSKIPKILRTSKVSPHRRVDCYVNDFLSQTKADVRSLAEASASMESEFRARQAESMENMRQMMEIISREKTAVVHRLEKVKRA